MTDTRESVAYRVESSKVAKSINKKKGPRRGIPPFPFRRLEIAGSTDRKKAAVEKKRIDSDPKARALRKNEDEDEEIGNREIITADLIDRASLRCLVDPARPPPLPITVDCPATDLDVDDLPECFSPCTDQEVNRISAENFMSQMREQYTCANVRSQDSVK